MSHSHHHSHSHTTNTSTPHYHPHHSPHTHTSQHPILHQISEHLNEKMERMIRERSSQRIGDSSSSSGTSNAGAGSSSAGSSSSSTTATGKSSTASISNVSTSPPSTQDHKFFSILKDEESIMSELTSLMFMSADGEDTIENQSDDKVKRAHHRKQQKTSGTSDETESTAASSRDSSSSSSEQLLNGATLDQYVRDLLIHAIADEKMIRGGDDTKEEKPNQQQEQHANNGPPAGEESSEQNDTAANSQSLPQNDNIPTFLRSSPDTHYPPKTHPHQLLLKQLCFHNQALNIINRKLNNTVMENYSQYMDAMTEIQNIGMDITMTSVLCRNSRTKLKHIQEREVLASLKIIEKSKQKQQMEQMLLYLQQIKNLLKESEKIDPLLEHKDFPNAVQTLLHCGKLLHSNDDLQQFAFIPNLSQDLHDKWEVISDKVSSALKHVCDQFDSTEYERILVANRMIENSSKYQSEVTQYYTANISKKLQNTARSYAYKRAQFEVENLSKLHFNDLCKYIHNDDVLSCCLQVFSVLSDVLYNYNAMFLWHKRHAARRRLKQQGKYHQQTDGGKKSQETSNGTASSSQTKKSTHPTSPEPISSSEAVLDYDFSSEYKFLDNFRGQIWETIQSNLAGFLASVQFEQFKPDRFLQVYHGVNLFCILGHQFASGKSFKLKKTLAEQTKNYFLKYHRREVLENIRIVIDNEHCQRLELNLKLSHMNISKKDWSSVNDQIRRVKNFLDTPSNKDEEAARMPLPDVESVNNIFREATLKGQFNIFSLEKSDFTASLDEYQEEESDDESDEESAQDHLSDSKIAEFFGDEINDSSKTKTSGKKRNQKRKSDNSYTVLNSTHTILKQIPFYMHAIQVFDLVRLELFFCLASVFRFYLYAMHSFFANYNQKEPLYPENDGDIPSDLEQVFTTIRRTLDKCNAEINPGTPFPLPVLQLSDVVYQAPLHGIVPRSNGAESLMFLKDVVEHLSPQLKPIMPKNKLDFVNSFIDEYRESTVEVRRIIYDRLVAHNIDMESYPSKISSSKFVVQQLRESNPYVQQFLSDMKRFFDQVTRHENELPPGAIRELWSSATRQLMDAMVEGFSRVKKCNNEGRALMQMDFNALQGGLNEISSYEISGLQKVKNYIQGYYFQESDIMDFIKKWRNEYTYKQIESLINAGCGANMKKKAKADLMAKVETIVDKGKEKNSRWLPINFSRKGASGHSSGSTSSQK